MNESLGVLTEAAFYILISVYTPLHGYGIMQNVEKMSSGRVKFGAGTLYGAINTLIKKGYIVEMVPVDDKENARNKKLYLITDEGKKAVNSELRRLEELLINGKAVVIENNEE